ncbi:MAG: antitoxin VbhA family protein [Spirochaetaceae bacterium]|nr:antitoxin VbhA family protein [Spirochaetaceae bacterium]
MVDSNKEQKRASWDFAININQLDGEWIPSDEYKELIEKEINGEITIQEMREIFNKNINLKNKI